MVIEISNSYRIISGGSWEYYDFICRLYRSYNNYPHYGGGGMGFRISRRCVNVNKN